MSINIVLIFIVVYIINMFNPSIIICKIKTKEDIRRLGCMDASVYNSFKVMGNFTGILVLLLTIFKVVLSYYVAKFIAIYLGENIASTMFVSTVILGCMIGHCFPSIYKFNGGKGIVEFITLMSIFSTRYVAVCMVVGLIIIALTRVIAKGTLAGCVLYLILSLINLTFNSASFKETTCVKINTLNLPLSIIFLMHSKALLISSDFSKTVHQSKFLKN